jgi:hypothetical protein
MSGIRNLVPPWPVSCLLDLLDKHNVASSVESTILFKANYCGEKQQFKGLALQPCSHSMAFLGEVTGLNCEAQIRDHRPNILHREHVHFLSLSK